MTEIFVFGSNLAGRHGKGAALEAIKRHGAIYGQPTGLQGQSYAIPTKNHFLRPLELYEIREHVSVFLDFAEFHKELTFKVTRIGCGFAGYKDTQIAPMFDSATANCMFSSRWKEYLSGLSCEFFEEP